jgi:hypothetical protein
LSHGVLVRHQSRALIALLGFNNHAKKESPKESLKSRLKPIHSSFNAAQKTGMNRA